MRLGDDVGKELIARALGLEPDRVHAQEHADFNESRGTSLGSTIANRSTLLIVMSYRGRLSSNRRFGVSR